MTNVSEIRVKRYVDIIVFVVDTAYSGTALHRHA